MSGWSSETATDCVTGSMDWSSIGARILETASLASAVHVIEAVGPGVETPSAREGRSPNRDGTGGPLRTPDAAM